MDENRTMEALAKKCIHDHRHPVVKVILPPNKLFFVARNKEEKVLIQKHQEQFLTILGHQRVEKRSSRAQANWLGSAGVAKVTKIVKNLVKYFGYQNKEGVFLYPEEMLYLLETNRLEVKFNDISISIEKAYELVLKAAHMNLNKYNVYKKLALLGYKLTRLHHIKLKTPNTSKKTEIKRCLADTEHSELPEYKKFKNFNIKEIEESHEPKENKSSEIYSDDLQAGTSMSKETEYVSDIFYQLRQNMPRDCTQEINSMNPDYCVFTPANTVKTEPDINLFICENNVTDLKNFTSTTPNVYAICIDDVSFYRFSNIHLPFI